MAAKEPHVAMSEDLEDYWELLRPLTSKRVRRTGIHALEDNLRVAAEKTIEELRREITSDAGPLSQLTRSYAKTSLIPEAISQIVSRGVEVFIRNWHESLQ